MARAVVLIALLCACSTARPWARVEHRKSHLLETKAGVIVGAWKCGVVATTTITDHTSANGDIYFGGTIEWSPK